MTRKSDPTPGDASQRDQQCPRSILNKRIFSLSWANVCMLIIWYLLYSEHHGSPTVRGTNEFSFAYKVVLLSLVALTIGVWGGLALAIWRRLSLGDGSEVTTASPSARDPM